MMIEMGELTRAWFGPEGVIAAGVLFGIYRQWRSDRRTAKTLAAATKEVAIATQMSIRAADSGRAAAEIIIEKAVEHTAVLQAMADDMHKIEIQGNSNQTRLEEAARAEGELAATLKAQAMVAQAERKVIIAETDLARATIEPEKK